MRASKEIESYFLDIIQTGLVSKGYPSGSLEISIHSSYGDEKDAFDTCYEYFIVLRFKAAKYRISVVKNILIEKNLSGLLINRLDNGTILLEMNVDISTWYSLNQLREISYE